MEDAENGDKDQPPDIYRWRLKAKFIAYIDVGISTLAVMAASQSLMAMVTDENAGENFTLTKIIQQVASGSAAAAYASAAKSLMNSTNRSCDPTEALEQASYWRKIHLAFMLLVLVALIGIALQLVPLTIFALVLVGFIVNVVLIYVVHLYIEELQVQVKLAELDIITDELVNYGDRPGGAGIYTIETEEPSTSPEKGKQQLLEGGLGWSKVWRE